MARSQTFGWKVGAGFAVTAALTVVTGLVAISSLRTVVASKDRVISVNAQNLISGQQLAADSAQQVVAVRGFLLSRQSHFLDDVQEKRAMLAATLGRLRA